MTAYSPPTRESCFILKQVLQAGSNSADSPISAIDGDLLEAIISEAARFAVEVIAPLNASGDRLGCTLCTDGSVRTPRGYPEAYADFVAAGWGTIALPEQYGGQGMPHVVATVIQEYFNSACQGFHMYPGLTHGAVATLLHCGSEDLNSTYLPKLVSGEWLGTMALTEAHAGTDLGLIRSRAIPREDGSFRISGEKIFCSGGDQDLTENIVHLVLARLPDAPPGSRGISLFLVPKILPDGTRNAVTCGSVEHKMGLRGSATCVMNFDDAAGWLVGEQHRGLSAMFIMMNAARLSCGNQGLAQAELAYQRASAYAIERRQGRSAGSSATADPIIVHPDVRRMLLDAKSFIDGFRALVLWTALELDRSASDEPSEGPSGDHDLVALLTPVIKAYGTDRGFDIAVMMQQVFGGHGYCTEWGMEQIVRDARAAMLYEGANGVQALDLVSRKLAKDDWISADKFFTCVISDAEAAKSDLNFIATPLREAVEHGRAAARYLLSAGASDANELGAGSYAFLQLLGVIAVGWMWLRLASASLEDCADPDCESRLVTARHYAERTIPEVQMLRRRVEAGAATVMALSEEAFGRNQAPA